MFFFRCRWAHDCTTIQRSPHRTNREKLIALTSPAAPSVPRHFSSTRKASDSTLQSSCFWRSPRLTLWWSQARGACVRCSYSLWADSIFAFEKYIFELIKIYQSIPRTREKNFFNFLFHSKIWRLIFNLLRGWCDEDSTETELVSNQLHNIWRIIFIHK